MSRGRPRLWYDAKSDRVKEYGPSRTKQNFAKECDVNNVIKAFKRTGLVTHVAKRPGFYADVSTLGDYKSAMDNVKQAESLFLELPHKTRERFGNDAAVFLDWCVDPKNTEEMQELGLLPKDEILPPAESGSAATPPAGGQESEANASEAEQ